MRTKIGNPGVLEAIIGLWTIAKSLGWFTKAEWVPELAGELQDGYATGGAVDELEEQTGLSFPHLQELRQEVVDFWHHVWRCFLWARPPAVEQYQAKVRELANALKKEAETYLAEIGYELQPWYLKYLPYGLMAGLGIGLIIVLVKRR